MVKLKQGDIIKFDFGPQRGSEQAGYRPAVIVSNNLFNTTSTMILACPVTHTYKKLPFRVKVESSQVDGYILCDQVKSLDLRDRKYKKVGSLTKGCIEEVSEILRMIVEPYD